MFRCCVGYSKYLMLLFIAAVHRHFPSSSHTQFGPRHRACAGDPEVAQPSWSLWPRGGNRSKQLTDGVHRGKDGAKLELEMGSWPETVWDIPVLCLGQLPGIFLFSAPLSK